MRHPIPRRGTLKYLLATMVALVHLLVINSDVLATDVQSLLEQKYLTYKKNSSHSLQPNDLETIKGFLMVSGGGDEEARLTKDVYYASVIILGDHFRSQNSTSSDLNSREYLSSAYKNLIKASNSRWLVCEYSSPEGSFDKVKYQNLWGEVEKKRGYYDGASKKNVDTLKEINLMCRYDSSIFALLYMYKKQEMYQKYKDEFIRIVEDDSIVYDYKTGDNHGFNPLFLQEYFDFLTIVARPIDGIKLSKEEVIVIAENMVRKHRGLFASDSALFAREEGHSRSARNAIVALNYISFWAEHYSLDTVNAMIMKCFFGEMGWKSSEYLAFVFDLDARSITVEEYARTLM